MNKLISLSPTEYFQLMMLIFILFALLVLFIAYAAFLYKQLEIAQRRIDRFYGNKTDPDIKYAFSIFNIVVLIKKALRGFSV